MKMISQSVSADVKCEHCEYVNDVMFHPSDDGDDDINSMGCCPPSEAYHEPTECGECGEELLVETDADEMNLDAYESHCDFKMDEARDERMMDDC